MTMQSPAPTTTVTLPAAVDAIDAAFMTAALAETHGGVEVEWLA